MLAGCRGSTIQRATAIIALPPHAIARIPTTPPPQLRHHTPNPTRLHRPNDATNHPHTHNTALATLPAPAGPSAPGTPSCPASWRRKEAFPANDSISREFSEFFTLVTWALRLSRDVTLHPCIPTNLEIPSLSARARGRPAQRGRKWRVGSTGAPLQMLARMYHALIYCGRASAMADQF